MEERIWSFFKPEQSHGDPIPIKRPRLVPLAPTEALRATFPDCNPSFYGRISSGEGKRRLGLRGSIRWLTRRGEEALRKLFKEDSPKKDLKKDMKRGGESLGVVYKERRGLGYLDIARRRGRGYWLIEGGPKSSISLTIIKPNLSVHAVCTHTLGPWSPPESAKVRTCLTYIGNALEDRLLLSAADLESVISLELIHRLYLICSAIMFPRCSSG